MIESVHRSSDRMNLERPALFLGACQGLVAWQCQSGCISKMPRVASIIAADGHSFLDGTSAQLKDRSAILIWTARSSFIIFLRKLRLITGELGKG